MTNRVGTTFGIRIETSRLILRPPVEADFGGYCALMGDEEAAKYIGGLQTPSQAWRGMTNIAGSWAIHGHGMFSLIEKSSGAWIGRAGPWQPHGWPGTEVGWGILRDYWGKGYALEAAVASMDFAVDQLGWNDIIHCIDPANVNSQKLAERLGSANRGKTKLPPPLDSFDVDAWGQTASDWRANRSKFV